jgi:hypothetical protein
VSSGERQHDRFARSGDKSAVAPLPADVGGIQPEVRCTLRKRGEKGRVDQALKNSHNAFGGNLSNVGRLDSKGVRLVLM